MQRIPPLAPEKMTPAQKRLADEIASTRGGRLGGPFAIWIRNPDMVEKAERFGSFLRTGTSLSRRRVELCVLITARFWSAQYEWYAHEHTALELGIPAEVVDAIKHRRRPRFDDPAEEAIYALCTELYETRRASDATYARALEALGEESVVDLVAIAGFYSMVALTLNAFEVDIPGGGAAPLDDA